MDLRLLQRIAAELRERLLEQEVHRVSCFGGGRYLLRFATPERDDVLLSLASGLPRLHLLPRGGGRRDRDPDAFGAALDRELQGARLVAIDLPPGERLVFLRFRRSGGDPKDAGRAGGDATRRTLVAELFGRPPGGFLLDEEDTILAGTRRAEGGRPGVAPGERYLPPAAPAGAALGASQPPVEREVTVRSRRPLDSWPETEPFRRDDFAFAWDEGAEPSVPLPQEPAAALPHATRFASPSVAAAAVFEPLERWRDFEEERARHEARARRESARLRNLASRLEEDEEKARLALGDRRRAEALLAGLSVARVEGGTATVPDPESLEGATIQIPIDPARTLAANAERLFDRFKKGKRAVAAIAARREALARRLSDWERVEALCREARTQADLEPVREGMAALGLVHRQPRAGRPSREAAAAPPMRVRRHETKEGFVVLVGRSGPENDTLTFRIASPWDFWLHAAGVPGAHVVVRNPRRLGTLPEPALQVAAGIAAFYSGAKNSGKVEVHVTQRRHVRKRKGAPPGQVLLRRFSTVHVPPGLPGPAVEDL